MHIFKLIISVLIFLVSVVIHSQDDFTIQLPTFSADTLINVDGQSNTINIRVFSNQTVFIGNNRVRYYDEITQKINDQIRQEWNQEQYSLKTLLYADKKVKYRVIDWIKTAISNSMSNDLCYMTNFSNTSFIGYQHKTNPPVYSNSMLGRIYTTDEEKDNFVFWGEAYRFILGTKPTSIQEQYHQEFYKNLIHPDHKNLLSFLKSKKYLHIILKKDRHFTIGNKTTPLNIDTYTELINESELAFVHFDKELLYQDYINYLEVHKKVMYRLKQKNPDHQKIIIEVYEELHDYLFNTNSPVYP